MKTLILFLTIFAGLFLAACGAPTTSLQTQNVVEVPITLTDFGIESPVTKFQKNVRYRFSVTNTGLIAHEFVIAKPQTSGGHAAHSGSEKALVEIRAQDLPAGATKTVEARFDHAVNADELEMACHIAGHYEAGMKLGIAVN